MPTLFCQEDYVISSGLVNWPSDIPMEVSTITVMYSPQLTTIPEEALLSFPQLTEVEVKRNGLNGTTSGGPLLIDAHLEQLNMRENRFTTFQLRLSTTSEKMSTLSELDLLDNSLEEFPDVEASIARNIVNLMLEMNRLTILSTEDLIPYVSLEWFSVHDNHIHTIQEFPLSTKSSYFFLSMTGNPLNCNANIMWLKLIHYPQILSIDYAPCVSPQSMVGENWYYLHIQQQSKSVAFSQFVLLLLV